MVTQVIHTCAVNLSIIIIDRLEYIYQNLVQSKITVSCRVSKNKFQIFYDYYIVINVNSFEVNKWREN